MKKIGILGGTFNPIHAGHVAMAKAAYDELSLDEIWLMPNNVAYYKEDTAITTNEHRAAMVDLAIRDFPYMETCLLELNRPGKTYTVDTLEHLAETYPGDEWYFIIGQDSLENFHWWKEPEKILDLAHLVVFSRGDDGSFDASVNKFMDQFIMARLHLIQKRVPDISSSEIRENICNGRDVSAMLDEKVCEYILQNKLYR